MRDGVFLKLRKLYRELVFSNNVIRGPIRETLTAGKRDVTSGMLHPGSAGRWLFSALAEEEFQSLPIRLKCHSLKILLFRIAEMPRVNFSVQQ